MKKLFPVFAISLSSVKIVLLSTTVTLPKLDPLSLKLGLMTLPTVLLSLILLAFNFVKYFDFVFL